MKPQQVQLPGTATLSGVSYGSGNLPFPPTPHYTKAKPKKYLDEAHAGNVDDEDNIFDAADKEYQNRTQVFDSNENNFDDEINKGNENNEKYDEDIGAEQRGYDDVYEKYLPDGSSCSLDRKESIVSWRTTWDAE